MHLKTMIFGNLQKLKMFGLVVFKEFGN